MNKGVVLLLRQRDFDGIAHRFLKGLHILLKLGGGLLARHGLPFLHCCRVPVPHSELVAFNRPRSCSTEALKFLKAFKSALGKLFGRGCKLLRLSTRVHLSARVRHSTRVRLSAHVRLFDPLGFALVKFLCVLVRLSTLVRGINNRFLVVGEHALIGETLL